MRPASFRLWAWAAWRVIDRDSAALGLRDTHGVVGALLSLLASLNMALFVFNLIPLPPLDGGHILGAVYEGVRRQVASLRGRRIPVRSRRCASCTWAVGGFSS